MSLLDHSIATSLEAADHIERLEKGLDAAIRAADLALFVIRKQGIMPNSSWQSGFEKDMAIAKAARGDTITQQGMVKP